MKDSTRIFIDYVSVRTRAPKFLFTLWKIFLFSLKQNLAKKTHDVY